MSRVGSVVLCGGRSSRMGRPKAWLKFGDETLLSRVVCVLHPVVAPIVVVSAPGQVLPELPASVLVAHDTEEYLGPLNGLAAGIELIAGQVEAVYVTACDVPFLTSAFVKRVIDRLGNNMICMPEIDGFRHPLAAVYRVQVLPAVRELLKENQRGPSALAEMLPTRLLTAADFADVDPLLRSLRNLNTPDEYAAALHELNQAPAGPGDLRP